MYYMEQEESRINNQSNEPVYHKFWRLGPMGSFFYILKLITGIKEYCALKAPFWKHNSTKFSKICNFFNNFGVVVKSN